MQRQQTKAKTRTPMPNPKKKNENEEPKEYLRLIHATYREVIHIILTNQSLEMQDFNQISFKPTFLIQYVNSDRVVDGVRISPARFIEHDLGHGLNNHYSYDTIFD